MISQGIASSLTVEISFWVISISTILSAIAVVQIKDLFRASLFLILTFLGVAGLFILLGAEFLAGIQLMIYVGAISVLIIFAILMTREIEISNQSHYMRILVSMVALGFMLLAISLITSTDWNLIDSRSFPQNQTDEIIATVQNSIPPLSKMLLTEYVLAFEMVGVLLLAAVLGALALVREKK